MPYPKASHAVLQKFAQYVEMEIDLEELEQQVSSAEEQFQQLYGQIQNALRQRKTGEFSEEPEIELRDEAEQESLAPEDVALIENLFEQARTDRSKAYELKRETRSPWSL